MLEEAIANIRSLKSLKRVIRAKDAARKAVEKFERSGNTTQLSLHKGLVGATPVTNCS